MNFTHTRGDQAQHFASEHSTSGEPQRRTQTRSGREGASLAAGPITYRRHLA